MKRIIFSAAIVMFCLVACNDSKTDSSTTSSSTENSTAQKNLAAMRSISDAFNSGNVSVVDSFVSSDFVDHTDHGDVKGVDSLKSMIRMMHETMKDGKTETLRDFADDDYAILWNRYTGTGDGVMMPKAPYDMQAMEVAKFKDGKAVEHWSFGEMQDMMEMMKNMPPMGQPMMKDTTKKK